MKNLLITICLGSMFVSANAMQPIDDDCDHLRENTTFSPLANNPQLNHHFLRLNDFVGNIDDPITVPVDFPDFPNIVIEVLGDPISETDWDIVISRDADLGLTNEEVTRTTDKLRQVLHNPDESYDKIIKVEIITPQRDDKGNIQKQGSMVVPITETLYIPEWFIAQDGTKRFVNNINNLSIDEIANNLTQSCAKKIRDYVFNGVRLFDQILDDSRRKTIDLVAAGGVDNALLKAFLNVNDNADLQTLENTLNNTLSRLGLNIRSCSKSYLQSFLDANLPDDQIKCLGEKIALYLKLVKKTGYIENAAYDVIFGEQADYSGLAVKKHPRRVDVFSALCEGSLIPDSSSANDLQKREGNNYAKGLFFRALRLLFGYNEREDTSGIGNFFQVEGPFWRELGRQGNPSNGRSIESLLNLLFFHCEDIADTYANNGLGSIQFSSNYCQREVKEKFGNAYVKIVDPEEINSHGFHMAYPPYRDHEGEVLGVSSNKICPPAQSRYIFRAFEKLMDRCEALNGEERDEVLDEIASIMGVLIQGFNNCDAGVAAAYNEVIKAFLNKEEHIEYDVLRYSVMQFTAEEIFSQLFQYKRIAGDNKESFINYENFNSEVTQLFVLNILGVDYVRNFLNGRYGIGTVNNSYDNSYAIKSDDYKRMLQVHLLGGRTRSTVIRKALDALYNNPNTQKWGIEENSRAFNAGDRAFDWVRTNRYGDRILDYSYYPSWWRPSSDVPENARNMTDEEYKEVITTMLDGVMSDLDLVLDVAIESPFISRLFDTYFQTCGFVEHRDDNNNANSGRRQENTLDIFSLVAGTDEASQRELKKKFLFKILKPTTEDELFIERIRH